MSGVGPTVAYLLNITVRPGTESPRLLPSPTGQLWGSPLYKWPAHKKEGFKWWTARMARTLELYDECRIDHFRGFAGGGACGLAVGDTRNGGPACGRRVEARGPVCAGHKMVQVNTGKEPCRDAAG